MTRPQVFGRQRRGTVQNRDTEFPSAPVHVSSPEKYTDSLPKPPQYHTSARPSRVIQDHRPSTSGGTSTRKLKEQKQETRDDLHFNAHPGQEVSNTYYNFPLPTSLPTPAVTPKPSPPLGDARIETEDPEVIETSVLSPMEIGMALGSPSHQPAAWKSNANYERTRPIDSPESMEQADDWKQAALQPKPKASKWKRLFGGGKKNTGQTQAFYQLQPEQGASIPVSSDMDQHYTTFPSPPSADERPRTRGRTNTISEKKAKQKPEIKRSQTVPQDFNFQNQHQPSGKPKHVEQGTPEIQLDGGPLLNVDIPRIELERYSVMFGSLLTKPTTQTSSNLLARRQATLDKLKLVNEAIAEHERHEAEARSKLLRPRRATSPQPTKSPAFSLFPTTPHGTRIRSNSRSGSPMTPRRISPHIGASLTLHRSNTSPAALSPNRQTFATSITSNSDLEPPRPHEEVHTIMLAPTPPPVEPERVKRINANAIPAPNSPWLENESRLVLSPTDSFASSSASYDDREMHVPQPLKPVLVEPSWEMVPPPQVQVQPQAHIQGSKGSDPGKARQQRNPTRAPSSGERKPDDGTRLASPLARNPSFSHGNSNGTASGRRKQALPSPQPQDDLSSSAGTIPKSKSISNRGTAVVPSPQSRRTRSEEDAQAAAEASIARQISVSQQQRKLLLPITTRGVGPKSAGGSAGSTPVSAVRTMTPTLVMVQGRALQKAEVEGQVAVFERA